MAAATMAAGMRRLQAAMRKLGAKYNTAMSRAMTSTAMRARAVMVAETDTKRVVNTGFYRRAWKAEQLANYTIRVFNDATYAGVIEKGRRVGTMPPVEPLARWAQRKFRIPYSKARGVGFAIARSIKRRGLPARNVLEDAKPKLRQAMNEEFTREITNALRTP